MTGAAVCANQICARRGIPPQGNAERALAKESAPPRFICGGGNKPGRFRLAPLRTIHSCERQQECPSGTNANGAESSIPKTAFLPFDSAPFQFPCAFRLLSVSFSKPGTSYEAAVGEVSSEHQSWRPKSMQFPPLLSCARVYASSSMNRTLCSAFAYGQ